MDLQAKIKARKTEREEAEKARLASQRQTLRAQNEDKIAEVAAELKLSQEGREREKAENRATAIRVLTENSRPRRGSGKKPVTSGPSEGMSVAEAKKILTEGAILRISGVGFLFCAFLTVLGVLATEEDAVIGLIFLTIPALWFWLLLDGSKTKMLRKALNQTRNG